MERNQCSLLYFCAGTIPDLARDEFRQGKLHEVSAMPHKNAVNLDSTHNAAIRAEIGERLRILLTKEQTRPPPRVQHLLDRLRALDATGGQPRNRRRRYLSWLKPRGGR